MRTNIEQASFVLGLTVNHTNVTSDRKGAQAMHGTGKGMVFE